MTDPTQSTTDHISPASRTGYILFAAALLIYASYAWYYGKIYIPARSGEGLTFTGTALKLICCGLFMAAAAALSVVAKSYNKRNNGLYYDRFTTVARAMALVLIAMGTIGSILYEYLMA